MHDSWYMMLTTSFSLRSFLGLLSGTDFLGGAGGGGCAPPRNVCTPQRHLVPPPKVFAPPQIIFIYFDSFIFDYSFTTKMVKLPILCSQISPCRPRKQILSNFFLGLSGRCHHPWPKQAAAPPPPPRYLSTPANKNMKIRLWLLCFIVFF